VRSERRANLNLDSDPESRHVPFLFPPPLGANRRKRHPEPIRLSSPVSRSMRTYLITHDQAGRAKQSLATAIMQLGEAWARPLESTWFVQSKERAAALEARLGPHLDGEEGLLIQEVASEAVLLNTSLRWFRKRQASAGELSNVVAFPLRAASEAKAA
jgi:hypothetical protein